MNLLNMYKDIYTHMCGIIESGWLMVNLNLGDYVRKSDNWPNFPAMEVLVFRVGSILIPYRSEVLRYICDTYIYIRIL